LTIQTILVLATTKEFGDAAGRQCGVIFRWTLCPNENAIDCTRAAAESSRRLVVEAIGDGSLHAVISGISKPQIRALVDCVNDDPNAFGYVGPTNAEGKHDIVDMPASRMAQKTTQALGWFNQAVWGSLDVAGIRIFLSG
jgi:hypothetical protein